MIHKVPPFNRGGAEQILWRTAKRFAEEGHEIVFYSPTGNLDREPPDVQGIEFEWVSTSNTRTKSQLEFFVKGAIQYPSVFRSVDPDLVYDNICPFPFHIAHFYGDADLASKVHAIYRRDALTCKYHWAVKIGTILGEESYRTFSDELFITNSESTKRRLLKLVRKDKNDIEANPIGIDTSEFEFNLALESDTVLSLSKLNPRKNIGALLDAWVDVEATHPTAKLVVAGSGPLESKLRSRSADLGLSRVKFEGFVSEKRKQELLQTSLIYVLPTRYEGFGLSNLEAMASGCAVVSTDTWGVKDYLKHEEDGLAVEPKDPNQLSAAILRLLDDRELLRSVADSGRETASSYTMNESLEREVDIVNDYLA